MEEIEIIEKGGIECYTPLEVKEILKISESKAYQLFRSEGFPSFRFGRNLRVTQKDFNVWLNQQKNMSR